MLESYSKSSFQYVLTLQQHSYLIKSSTVNRTRSNIASSRTTLNNNPLVNTIFIDYVMSILLFFREDYLSSNKAQSTQSLKSDIQQIPGLVAEFKARI